MSRLCTLLWFQLKQTPLLAFPVILLLVFLLPACIFTNSPTPIEAPTPLPPTLENQSSEFAPLADTTTPTEVSTPLPPTSEFTAVADTPTAAPLLEPTDDDKGNDSAAPTATVPIRQVQPEELLPVIAWGGFGGGSDLVEACRDGFIHVFPSSYMGNGQGYRYLDAQNVQIDMGRALRLEGCNYQNGEVVNVSFFLPDGTTDEGVVIAVDEDVTGYWAVDWFSIPGEPLGEYRVKFDSPSGTIEGPFFVLEPAAPVLTVYCIVEGEEGLAVMAGFEPQEEVLLARYDEAEANNATNLADYQYVQMDLNGMALVDIPAVHALFIAIGSERPVIASSNMETFPPEGETRAVSAYDYMFFPGKSCS